MVAGATHPASILASRISLALTSPPAVAAAYVGGDPRALGFFSGDPFDPVARHKAAERAAQFPRDREVLATVLAEQNAGWAASSSAVDEAIAAAVETLRDPTSVAVVTGQQPGLFGGPLFTVYKALTAIRLAARLREELGRPAVPVFWIADEDHDFAEMHATKVAVDGRVIRLAYEDGRPPGENRGAVGRLVLGEGIGRVVDALERAAIPGPFASDLVAAMREVWQPGVRWRDAFARTLRVLLPGAPLVLMSSDDARLKRLASPLFVEEAADWTATHRAHAAQTQALEQAGFAAQVVPRPLHLFKLEEAQRLALDPADPDDIEAGVVKRATGRRLSKSDLVEIARSAPETLSPDVVLRPVTQDTLLPTACYVAGPGELAYFAQMAGVYERFGIPMPLIAPRATMTLVEPAIRRALGALEIDVEAVLRGAATRGGLKREAPAVDGALTEVESAVEAALLRAGDAVRSLDGSLDRAAGAAAARTRRALATLRLKTERVARRRRADDGARAERVQAALLPEGKLQERALSALGPFARYGPQMAELIEGAIDLESREHAAVDLP